MKTISIVYDDGETFTEPKISSADKALYKHLQRSLDKLTKLNKAFDQFTNAEKIDLEQPMSISTKTEEIVFDESDKYKEVSEPKEFDLTKKEIDDVQMNPVGNKKFIIKFMSPQLITKKSMISQVRPIDMDLLKVKIPESLKTIVSLNPSIMSIGDLTTICLVNCKEQVGSRIIQEKIESWNENEIDIFIEQIEQFIKELSTNLFGNYVIQKLIEHSNKRQLSIFRNSFVGYMVPISNNIYGCRVIQKLIEVDEDIDVLVGELFDGMELVYENNHGSHVFQRLAEIKKYQSRLVSIIKPKTIELAINKFGCRIIQTLCLNTKNSDQLAFIILSKIDTLIIDQFGNYIIQMLVQQDQYKNYITHYIKENIVFLSKNKYSSNVVEKLIRFIEPNDLEKFFNKCLVLNQNNIPYFIDMICDSYGNYVAQSLYVYGNKDIKYQIESLINKYKDILKKSPYVKHILYKMNK
ncbi:PUM4 [Hepatospora eriocheir]|uniref:PUM4 n=1 Tax=Hepatospora eriocheir TaxID=1081669 RepID=A0A1X0QG97_9MICR|nr:PUM4 [Hepatospora eriocheir]